jgi:hypothetical protein
MIEETKKEWKVGDELAVCIDTEYEIHKITKISKTGRMTLGNDRYIADSNLVLRGLGSWSRVHHKAHEVTDEIRAEASRSKKISKVSLIFRTKPASMFNDDELDQIITAYNNALGRQILECSQK